MQIQESNRMIAQALEELDKHEAIVYELIICEVKRLARYVLANNKGVKEFIMAMGMFSITRKYRKDWQYDHVEDYEFAKLKGGADLYDFLTEHNNRFKLTGDPMRFTATGDVITDW